MKHTKGIPTWHFYPHNFFNSFAGVVCNCWLDLIKIHWQRGLVNHNEAMDHICQGSEGLMILRKFGKANPATDNFEQDVKDGKCKTKNAWWHVQEKVFDLAKVRIYAPMCYNYRDWRYNAAGEPMPISYHHMTGSLIRALEKSPEIKFKKTKREVTSRSLLLMPLLAQLIGLVDHLKEWDWAKTD